MAGIGLRQVQDVQQLLITEFGQAYSSHLRHNTRARQNIFLLEARFGTPSASPGGAQPATLLAIPASGNGVAVAASFPRTRLRAAAVDERALLLPRGPYDFGISLYSQRRASAEPLAESQTGRPNFLVNRRFTVDP